MELLVMALAAKSRALQGFLLNNATSTPDVERRRRVFQLAVTANDDLCSFLLGRLALWDKDDLHVPKVEIVRPGKSVWVNKKELIEYWKERLG
jgi:hypothetical protein